LWVCCFVPCLLIDCHIVWRRHWISRGDRSNKWRWNHVVMITCCLFAHIVLHRSYLFPLINSPCIDSICSCNELLTMFQLCYMLTNIIITLFDYSLIQFSIFLVDLFFVSVSFIWLFAIVSWLFQMKIAAPSGAATLGRSTGIGGGSWSPCTIVSSNFVMSKFLVVGSARSPGRLNQLQSNLSSPTFISADVLFVWRNVWTFANSVRSALFFLSYFSRSTNSLAIFLFRIFCRTSGPSAKFPNENFPSWHVLGCYSSGWLYW